MNRKGGLMLSIIIIAVVFIVGFIVGMNIITKEKKGEESFVSDSEAISIALEVSEVKLLLEGRNDMEIGATLDNDKEKWNVRIRVYDSGNLITIDVGIDAKTGEVIGVVGPFSVSLNVGSEQYCLGFSVGECPEECEVRSLCPECDELERCHAKLI
ncbi:MAG: PepSY domain-containing protein [Nanoarchaeota archaeon]|nr:PepSY domain-containing protein [Nanoarchaeota archaeon]